MYELDGPCVRRVDGAQHFGGTIFYDRRNVTEQNVFGVRGFCGFAELFRRCVERKQDRWCVRWIENCGVDDEEIGVFGEFLEVAERGCVHVAGEGDALIFELDAVGDGGAIAVVRGDFADF